MASLQENEGYDFNEATAKNNHELKAIGFTVERVDNLSMSDYEPRKHCYPEVKCHNNLLEKPSAGQIWSSLSVYNAPPAAEWT